MATNETTNETTTDESDDDEIIVMGPNGVVADDDTPRPRHGHAGRPPLVIDIGKLHAVASTFASYDEMAVIFDCSRDTLRRRYSREIEKGRAMGRMGYRQMMRERAKRSDRVLIHMYEKHVEMSPAKGDTVVQIVGDTSRPLIIRETDEDSDTMR